MEASRKYNLPISVEDGHTTINEFLADTKTPEYQLSLMVNQRSCDVGLGVPFNVVQYSFLLRMFAMVANMAPGEMIWNGGDTHIYQNHVAALEHQLKQIPRASPTFRFARNITDIDNFKYEDFVVEGYDPDPAIKMEVAV